MDELHLLSYGALVKQQISYNGKNKYFLLIKKLISVNLEESF